MKPKNILYVVLSLYAGGLENGIVNLINNSSKEFKHIVCCLRNKGIFSKRLKPHVKIIEMNMSMGNDYLMPLKLARVISREDIDLIRAFTEDPLFYSFIPAMVLNRKPLIYYNGGRTFPEKKKRVLLECFLANRVSAVAVPSIELRDYMHKEIAIKKENITVIPNGIDLNRFRNNIDKKRKKETLCIPVNDIVIGTVGRLVEQKDYPTLLHIAKTVLQKKQHITFIIVGDGKLRKELENIAKENGIADKVKFLGIREDIEELYQVMDIFILTARWEGMSNVVLEAMASKKPVLATDVEGMTGVIENGINGFLFTPGDVDGFVTTILSLTQNEMSRIGENAYRKVKEIYSLENMIHTYEKLNRKLL